MMSLEWKAENLQRWPLCGTGHWPASSRSTCVVSSTGLEWCVGQCLGLVCSSLSFWRLPRSYESNICLEAYLSTGPLNTTTNIIRVCGIYSEKQCICAGITNWHVHVEGVSLTIFKRKKPVSILTSSIYQYPIFAAFPNYSLRHT